MRSSNQYWTKRALELEADLHLEAQLTYDKLDGIILQALDFISKLITDWYGRYMPDGSGDYVASKKRLTPSELTQFKSRFKRYLKVVESYDDERIKRLFYRLGRVNTRTHLTRLEALQTEFRKPFRTFYMQKKNALFQSWWNANSSTDTIELILMYSKI